MDSKVAHTFPQAGTSQLLSGSFGYVPRKTRHFDRLITQVETWVHHYDPETEVQLQQWKQFNSPPPKEGMCLTPNRQGLLGPAQSCDDGFPGKGYHNYRGLLCFTAEEIARGYQKRGTGC